MIKGILGIIYLVLVVIGILDCIKKDWSGGKKVIWILLILFVPYVGTIAYFLIGKKS